MVCGVSASVVSCGILSAVLMVEKADVGIWTLIKGGPSIGKKLRLFPRNPNPVPVDVILMGDDWYGSPDIGIVNAEGVEQLLIWPNSNGSKSAIFRLGNVAADTVLTIRGRMVTCCIGSECW